MEEERKLLRDLNLMEVLTIRQCLHMVSNRINIGEHTVIRGKQKYISDKIYTAMKAELNKIKGSSIR